MLRYSCYEASNLIGTKMQCSAVKKFYTEGCQGNVCTILCNWHDLFVQVNLHLKGNKEESREIETCLHQMIRTKGFT